MDEERNEDNTIHGPPAGFIPPEFREYVYAEDLTAAEQASIDVLVKVVDEDSNEPRAATPEELAGIGVRKLLGVRDTRDGTFHPTISDTPMMEISVDFND